MIAEHKAWCEASITDWTDEELIGAYLIIMQWMRDSVDQQESAQIRDVISQEIARRNR